MRVTIDRAGRLVVPKQLRDAVGLVPGEVEMVVDGSGIRIDPAPGSGFVEQGGRWVIDDDVQLSDDDVRTLRFGDQK
jgi:AbrB family looped-hinge helix DNA binding protein